MADRILVLQLIILAISLASATVLFEIAFRNVP